jgi:hypothetical protein
VNRTVITVDRPVEEEAGRPRGLWVAVVAGVVIAATIVGVILGFAGGGSAEVPDVPGSASDVVAEAPAPSRLVGLGHAAIAVPATWGTNETRCGVPQVDTVVIDVGSTPACAVGRRPGIESVEIWQGGPRFDYQADESGDLGGVRFERQSARCGPGGRGARMCVGTIHIPSEHVFFRAESSTSVHEVNEILGWVRIVEGTIGVPGFQVVDSSAQGGARAAYVRALRESGLVPRLKAVRISDPSPGWIVDVSPPPGTLVAPGTVVTVAAMTEPEDPAYEVRVGMNTSSKNGDFREFSDARIRSGATIKIRVGDHVWAYGQGKGANTLVGVLRGTSIRRQDRKDGLNQGLNWVAASPGRTTVELAFRLAGRRYVLGVVTVVVR